MNDISVKTIGFTKTTAKNFFERIINSGVKKVVDVRLNNTSQLSGFAKSEDLAFFLKKIAGVEYVHIPILAPTKEILSEYRGSEGSWRAYEGKFLSLMEQRKIEDRLKPEMLRDACLLCSEDKPHHCHRRLVCEYLNSRWGGPLTVKHL